MLFPKNLLHRIEMQGFSCRADTNIMELQRWLRFTPMISTIFILAGIFFTSPVILILFAIVSIAGAGMKQHPFDMIYNKGIRQLTGTPPLPANPVPRRFSMGLASLLSVIVAVLFIMGYTLAGYLLGGILFTAALTMSLTHFCLGAWIYSQLLQFLYNPERETP